MTRRLVLLLVAAGCAAPAPPPDPESIPFAAHYVESRSARAVPRDDESPDAAAETIVPIPPKTAADERRGLVLAPPARVEELRADSADEGTLAAILTRPLSSADLAALAWLRSPEVEAARAELEAARTGYAQSADLRDLVALYRSFVRETRTRVGPEASRRATGSIAPSPNVDALSGEVVARTVEIAFERLRHVVRDVVAAAEIAHADAARLVKARRIVGEDVRLHEALVAVLRARFEAGKSKQAALLAFQARLEALRTELRILAEESAAVRARWNRLLHRPESAPVNLDVAPSGPAPAEAPRDDAGIVTLALEERQECRIARLAADRAAVAVRLAETMTLPRMDLGTSRFERERAGEAGAQRGAVFPQPGRAEMPRWDFGVREAQVTEMRARRRAAERSRNAVIDETQAVVRSALFSLEAARRRWRVHKTDLVPLAVQSFEAVRGAYESNDAGYIELLDGARELLRARLGLVDARRAHAHARAARLRAVGVHIDERE